MILFLTKIQQLGKYLLNIFNLKSLQLETWKFTPCSPTPMCNVSGVISLVTCHIWPVTQNKFDIFLVKTLLTTYFDTFFSMIFFMKKTFCHKTFIVPKIIVTKKWHFCFCNKIILLFFCRQKLLLKKKLQFFFRKVWFCQ